MSENKRRDCTRPVRVLLENEKLSDGSFVPNVFIRWDGGFMKIAPESEEVAERLMNALKSSAYIDVTVY